MAAKRYRDVMKCIIRRYITAEQKKAEEFSITEDDVSEIRQDINKFRYSTSYSGAPNLGVHQVHVHPQ